MTLLQEFHGSNTIMYDVSGVVVVASDNYGKNCVC
jgi:hypothetical protein